MYQLNQTYCNNLLDALKSLTFKSKDIKLVSLDISSAVDEYCRFVKALVGCRKIAEEEYQKVQNKLQTIKALKEKVKDLTQELSTVQAVDNVQLDEDGVSQADISQNFNQTLDGFRDNFINLNP